MSKRMTKHTMEKKLATVTAILKGRDSTYHLSKVHSPSSNTIFEWINPSGLKRCKNLEQVLSTQRN